MSSGADLFVVCKQCGSEVSPYITECPYCGHRLRRRAPKLPRAHELGTASTRPKRRFSLRGRGASARTRTRGALSWEAGRLEVRPYATIAIVALSCLAWVLWRGGFVELNKMIVLGPLEGDWWRLFTNQFAYENGFYEFVTLVAIAIFGWLLENRHGPLVVLALFLGAGVAGALVAVAVYPVAVVSGGDAGALALLAAWAAPDLRAARSGEYYEGDLLGAGAIALVLLVVPFAHGETSWLATVTGGVVGLLAGMGLRRTEHAES